MPNTFAALGAHGPTALKSILAADAVLAYEHPREAQTKRVIKLVVSDAAGCDYCVAAHDHLAKLAGLLPGALKQIALRRTHRRRQA